MKTTLIFLSLLFLVGCSTTSLPFQTGAASYGHDTALEALRYAQAETGPATVSHIAAAQQLVTDTATVSKVDKKVVSVDWLAVESWFLADVNADPRLDANAKALRVSNAAEFDKLIKDELAR